MTDERKPIYLIQYKGTDYDGRPEWKTAEWEGYFTSVEAAEEWIAKKENFEARYQAYRQNIETSNRAATVKAEALAEAYDKLIADGVSPGFFRPRLPARQETPLSFEQYTEHYSEYNWTEVDPG